MLCWYIDYEVVDVVYLFKVIGECCVIDMIYVMECLVKVG